MSAAQNANRTVLGKIANITSGGTPSRGNPAYWNGNIPWVKTTQIQNCLIKAEDVDEHITNEGLENSSAKMVSTGTILMAMYGQGKTRGQVGILQIDATINQACAAIELKDDVDRDFVYQSLLGGYKRIRAMSNTGGQENLSAGLLQEIPLTLPPLAEQKAIAELLSTWDDAIEKTERLIQAKEKQIRFHSRSFLFGKRRLKRAPHDLVKGRFFEYAQDWKLLPLSRIANEVSARNDDPNATVLSCSKHRGFVNSLDYFGKKVYSEDTSNYKVIRKNQFGYPANHIEEGSIGLLELLESGIVSPIYVVFKVDQEKVNPAYLYRILKTDIYRHIFKVNTSSSVDRRGSLRWHEFSMIKVPLPSIEEQNEIADFLATARSEIDILKQQCEQYKTQKRGLMQKLLTGTWRIKPEVVDRYEEVQ